MLSDISIISSRHRKDFRAPVASEVKARKLRRPNPNNLKHLSSGEGNQPLKRPLLVFVKHAIPPSLRRRLDGDLGPYLLLSPARTGAATRQAISVAGWLATFQVA